MKKLFPIFIFLLISTLSSLAETTNEKKATASLANRPLLFMENKGQVINDLGKPEPGILFTAKNKGVNLYMQNDGIVYQFTKTIYPENYREEEMKSKFSGFGKSCHWL